MTIRKSLKGSFYCDLCDSSNIVETTQGYVCSQCGLLVETHKFEFNIPFESEKRQHEILSSNTIGTKHEQIHSHNSQKFLRLQSRQIHYSHSYLSSVRLVIYGEVSRIFSICQYPRKFQKIVCEKTYRIWNSLRPGTKYRNPILLTPLIIYYVLKANAYPIKSGTLLESSPISRKEFNAFRTKAIGALPKYRHRNRIELIYNSLTEFASVFSLGSSFYPYSQKLVKKLWPLLKFYRDSTVASVITIILTRTFQKYSFMTIKQLCEYFGTSYRTVQVRIAESICEPLNIKTFTTIGEGKEAFRCILQKLEVIPSPPTKPPQKDDTHGSEGTESIEKVRVAYDSNTINRRDIFVVRGENNVALIFSAHLKGKGDLEVEFAYIERGYIYDGKGPPDTI
ncbi:MAG: hypothetical protein GF311_19630 [Candidatus Lokiarchaeota archaeon]|nr:hypothetical protein [Candidatus Lokiarchaeota archaeon]